MSYSCHYNGAQRHSPIRCLLIGQVDSARGRSSAPVDRWALLVWQTGVSISGMVRGTLQDQVRSSLQLTSVVDQSD